MATALSHHQIHSQAFSAPTSTTAEPNSPDPATPPEHYCKDCNIMFDTSASLEVHINYHKENLLSRWAGEAMTSSNNSNTTNSSSNNSNMDAKAQQQREASPQHGRMDQQSPPTSTPYYQTQYNNMSSSQYNNNTGDPPTTTSSGETVISTTSAYRPTPSYPDQQHYSTSVIQGHGISLQQQQPQLFSPPTQRHYDERETDQPPPPAAKTERPAEILDLDSNKVHVYHLPNPNQQHQSLGSFYRPYLMSQTPPSNNNWPPGDHFPQDPHHHHHFAQLYGGPPPPPTGSNIMMYDFAPEPGQRGSNIAYAPPPSDQQPPPPMPYQHPPPGVPQNFREFPPTIDTGSPGGPLTPGQRHSPLSSSTPVTGKKGKKAKMMDNNINEDGPPTKGKWKGGECKRPKTYNCTACNKWFTSSGHLKRHYGTTLHKNSIRQKGENPDDPTPAQPGKKGPKKGSRANQAVIPNGNNASMDMDTSLPPGSSPRNSNGMVKSEDSSSGKSTPVLFNGRQEFGNGQQGGPSPTPPYNSPYIHAYNVPLSSPMHPGQYNPMVGGQQFHSMTPVPYSNGFAPESSLSTPSIYSVPSPVVPTTVFNGGYPTISVNGEIPGAPLPPFSSVAFSHYGGELIPGYGPPGGGNGPFPPNPNPGIHRMTTPNGNGPMFLHHGSLGPPGPGSPQPQNHHGGMESSYESESGVNSSGPLNGESPEAVRSSSIASGSIEGSLDGLSDDGSPLRNGSMSLSSGSGPDSEPETIVTASGETVIKCPNCSKTFNRSCYLTQHTNSSHSGGKPFKCPTCGKRFSAAPALEDHEAKHGSNKPYKCDLCPKQFNHKTDLRRHLCLHTGEKPFVCNFCGKGFIRKDHMTKHCETHRKVKGSAGAHAAPAQIQVQVQH